MNPKPLWSVVEKLFLETSLSSKLIVNFNTGCHQIFQLCGAFVAVGAWARDMDNRSG